MIKKNLLFFMAGLLFFQANAQQAIQKTPNLVTVSRAQQLVFYPQKSAPAKVIALNHGKIPARVAGIIQRLNLRVGDNLKQGDIIARLDCQDLDLTAQQMQSQIQQAELTLAFNQREYQRAIELKRKKSISDAELDQKQTQANTSQQRLNELTLNLQQQRLNVQRCDITAPFDGMVTAKWVNIGEQVNPGQTIIELLQSDQQEVSAQIALTDRQTFHTASSYWFEHNGQKLPLRLRQLIPLVKDNSHSLESRLEFTAKNLDSGTTGRLVWTSSSAYLPAYLLQKRQGHYGFFIVEQEDKQTIQPAKARFIKVADALEGHPIPLTHALTTPHQDISDYQLIIDGRLGLQDNQKVKVRSNE